MAEILEKFGGLGASLSMWCVFVCGRNCFVWLRNIITQYCATHTMNWCPAEAF